MPSKANAIAQAHPLQTVSDGDEWFKPNLTGQSQAEVRAYYRDLEIAEAAGLKLAIDNAVISVGKALEHTSSPSSAVANTVVSLRSSAIEVMKGNRIDPNVISPKSPLLKGETKENFFKRLLARLKGGE